MIKNIVFATTMFVLCGPGVVRADILLNLVNPPGENNEPFSLNYTATGTVTEIGFAGYQAPARLFAEGISLTTGGSGNLLGLTWDFIPFNPADTTDAGQFNDGFGTGTNGLHFENGVGNLDLFEQSVATVPGHIYTLGFQFTNFAAPNNAPSELIVSATAVPEPSSVVPLGLALVGVALLMRRKLISLGSL